MASTSRLLPLVAALLAAAGGTYQGEKFDCAGFGVKPEVTVTSACGRKAIKDGDTMTAAVFKQYFSDQPKFVIDHSFQDLWFSIFLITGKAKATIDFAWVNVSGHNISNKKTKTVVSRGLKRWRPPVPSEGETYRYEVRVVKQKVEAVLPTNGADVDVHYEYEQNVRPDLCADYRDLRFFVAGPPPPDKDVAAQIAKLKKLP